MRRVQDSVVLVAAGLMLALVCPSARADVTLPHIFGSNMVLQRDVPLPVWGWAAPGEKVTVSIAGQTVTARADDAGQWRVKLAPLAASEKPLMMTVAGKDTLKLDNILVGEVWVCSGQSNMEFPVRQVVNADKEIAAADYPSIRLFDAPRVVSPEPTSDILADWQVCTPQTVSGFSAVGYFFGRDLQKQLHVPIGLISTNWGGTRIEPWTPAFAFAAVPALHGIAAEVQECSRQENSDLLPLIPSVEVWVKAARDAQANGHPVPPLPPLPGSSLSNQGRPTTLYNGMVAPLVPFAIRGAIWYQGEANLRDGMLYFHKMQALIAGWRKAWNQGDFPFYYVQIAPYQYRANPMLLPELWQAQTAALAIPNTGMAVTNDIGTIHDIHPRNKQEVGRRLSLWALAGTYGKHGIVYSGPLYKSMKIDDGKIRVSFEHVGTGLASRDGKPLTWFEIAGPDGKFVSANAAISGDTVVVSSDKVKHPVAVRFAWSQEAEPNLMNKEGLPASAFEAGRVADGQPTKAAAR